MSNKYDKVLGEYREDDATRCLKLDQTIEQTVVNGLPTFNEGLYANGGGPSVFNSGIIIRSGMKLVFDG
jgi:hypothetical protein